eukprot:scaffold1659_cov255-Pinguiococcus_pyrenoidosus.AAC.47
MLLAVLLVLSSPVGLVGMARSQPRAITVFGGGTAANAYVAELATWTPRVTHVLPVSDDGGSSAEIKRVLGGPAIGDIRSRLLRLAVSGLCKGEGGFLDSGAAKQGPAFEIFRGIWRPKLSAIGRCGGCERGPTSPRALSCLEAKRCGKVKARRWNPLGCLMV